MQSDFSEFSFGFALSHEICVATPGMKAAPVMPSLVSEGRSGGYDIRIDRPGIPLLLQFKLSELLSHPTAAQWDCFRAPYLRFYVTARRRSQQHRLLLGLDDARALVLYAAPRFTDVASLNSAFSSSALIANSIFFRPRDIGDFPDLDAHPIAFLPGARSGFVFSTPRAIPAVDILPWPSTAVRSAFRTLTLSPPTPDIFLSLARRISPASLDSSLGTNVPMIAPALGELNTARIRAATAARLHLGAELLWLEAP